MYKMVPIELVEKTLLFLNLELDEARQILPTTWNYVVNRVIYIHCPFGEPCINRMQSAPYGPKCNQKCVYIL